MDIQVVEDGVHPLDLWRNPGIHSAEEVDPVGDGPPTVRGGECLAGGRLEGAEDVAFASSTVVDLLRAALGWLVGVRRHGAHELLTGKALGRLRPHLIEAEGHTG